jgi:methyl-galactoside transport system substrate-binding protein
MTEDLLLRHTQGGNILKKLLVTVIGSALLLTACGNAATTPPTTTPGTTPAPATAVKPKIGVTIYKYDDNFMSFVRRAIEKNSDKADLLVNDSQNDQTKQNEQVDTMTSKGVKALAINLVSPQGASTIIQKAKAANLPVIFFNKEPSQTDLKSYDKAWYVGTTSSESGVLEGQLVLDAWKAHPEWDKNKDGKIQYVLLKGEPGHPDAEARTKFSIDTITGKGVQVEKLEEQTGMWDSVKGKELMDTWLAKHADKIEFVICNNDAMALGAIQSLKANGYFKDNKFMPVVGVDAIPDALTLIKDGTMVGSVLNDAKNQGQATFDLANNVAQGKQPTDGSTWKLGDDKAVRVPYVAITKANISVAEEAYK